MTSRKLHDDPVQPMRARVPAWRRVCWSIAAMLPFLYSALAWRSQTFSESGRIPLGHDAVFHAVRALEMAQGHWHAYTTRIHAPEGSWLVWPWAWDGLLAALSRISQALDWHTLELPMVAPVLLGVFNLALIAWLVRALIGDRGAGSGISLGNMRFDLLAVIAVGLSPSFVQNHAFGAIDHHAAELSVLLTVLVLFVRMHTAPAVNAALALGLVLGFSHAIHPGLFIWHLPLALASALLWLQGRLWPGNQLLALAAGLLLGLLVAMAPATSVHAGLFRFDVFSGFHVMVTLWTAIALLAMRAYRASPGSIAVLLVCGIAAAMPLLLEVRAGMRFVSGDFEFYRHLAETMSILAYMHAYGPGAVSRYYGPVLVFGGLALIAVLARGAARAQVGLAVLITVPMILWLGLSQVRYAYFLIPILWIALICGLAQLLPRCGGPVRLALAVTVLLSVLVALPMQLSKPSIGADALFASSQGFWQHIGAHCEEGQPIVLAEPVFGHYINYFSECRTVASNFISNSHHEQKVQQVYAALAAPPQQFRDLAPFADMVLVRINPLDRSALASCGAEDLGSQLICDTPLDGFELLQEQRLQGADGRSHRLLGLFRVVR